MISTSHQKITPGLVTILVFILAVFLIWGNFLVFQKLLDIRHKNAPMPTQSSYFQSLAHPPSQTVVRVGVVSKYAPNIIYRLYQPIIDYLNIHSSNHHQLALSESYQDAARSLRLGEVQASFLGAWMCHNLPSDSGLIPVAMPLNAQGVSQFQVVLVTAENSTVRGLEDLKSCKVAVPSDQAFSGNWLQNGGLESAGLKLADLDTIQHFQHHETVIWQVLRGNFAAGVVKESLALKYQTRGLRTVAISPAIPGPPLVICKTNQSAEVQELIQLMLDLDYNNPQDQALMESWTPEFAYGFIPVSSRSFKEDFLKPQIKVGASP